METVLIKGLYKFVILRQRFQENWEYDAFLVQLSSSETTFPIYEIDRRSDLVVLIYK